MSYSPQLLFDGDPAGPCLALAHGAGAAMDTPFMSAMAARIAEQGVRVARFEFEYMHLRRVDGKKRGPDGERKCLECWRDVIARLPRPLAIGGKSMGGRMASLLADEQQVAALVCLGYPFHPAGKPDKLRVAHLESIRTPTLILQGERDSLGDLDEVSGYRLSDSIQVEWLPDGDHSFKPRRSSGHTEQGNWQTAADSAAAFLKRVPGFA
ncbi:MAG: dienelactone hydrolase family protein [Planctomycetales bacterium]|nr:dienelactone hydrolase family protein [Planctomycetales bacterium]